MNRWLPYVPNALTSGRIVLAGAVFGCLLAPHPWPRTALVLFVVACVTDALDGYLARRYRAASAFGRIADPAADKILVCGALIILLGDEPLCAATGLAAWMVFGIVVREMVMMSLRGVLESRGSPFGARGLGKFKAVLQFVTVGMLLGRPVAFPGGEADRLLQVLLPATVALTWISCIPYLRGRISPGGA